MALGVATALSTNSAAPSRSIRITATLPAISRAAWQTASVPPSALLLPVLAALGGCRAACGPSGVCADTADTAGEGGDSPADTGETADTAPRTHGLPPDAPLAAPTFVATADDGTARGRDDLLGHRTLLWFFPTVGGELSATEGQGFAARAAAFGELGVVLVGVSFDEPAELAAWRAEQAFPFELWGESDARTLAWTYGAVTSMDQGFPGRASALLDEAGDLALRYPPEVDPEAHPQDVLDDCLLLWDAP